MDCEICKTCDLLRLIPNLSDKTNLKWSDKYVAISNLSIYFTGFHTINKFKIYLLQHEMMNSNYQMDNFLYQIFKISFNASPKDIDN